MDAEEPCCMDPETLKVHDEVCQMRRETGLCPQLPVIDQLLGKITWLIEAYELDLELDDIPNKHCGRGEL